MRGAGKQTQAAAVRTCNAIKGRRSTFSGLTALDILDKIKEHSELVSQPLEDRWKLQ
jgi:hypothetical protein